MLKPIHKSELRNFPFKEKGINNILLLEDICSKKEPKPIVVKDLIENYAVNLKRN